MKAGEKQTVFDIAIQCYGSLEGIAFLLEDNPELTLDSGDINGTEIVIANRPINVQIVKYFIDKNKKPSTAQ